MASASKCSTAAKSFQKLLVYEPLKGTCRHCDKRRPYPNAPPFGTSLKVCTFREMELTCFPKLCNCPVRECPPCPGAKRTQSFCKAFKLLATASLVAFLWDIGIFRRSKDLTDEVELSFQRFFHEEEHPKNQRLEYEKAVKQYNVLNIWNGVVIVIGDTIICLKNVPKFILKLATEYWDHWDDEPEDTKKKPTG